MQAHIDRVAWSASDVSAERTATTIVIHGISVSGGFPSEETFTITITDTTVGTEFPLGTLLHHAEYTRKSEPFIAFGVRNGSVTLTALDSAHVSGFFGFTGIDTSGFYADTPITNGRFSIDF